MTATIIAVVVVLIALAAAGYVIQQRNRQADVDRSDHLREQAATRAQATIAPAQERAATAEAEAEEARAAAEQAEAEAAEARLAAQQEEAAHEGQLRAADRLDPRVDHEADDYSPQVPGTADQQPTPAPEAGTAPAEPAPAEPAPAEPAPAEQPDTEQPGQTPLLPRRTPGAQEMPGKPIERSDEGGGWFTKKDTGPGQS